VRQCIRNRADAREAMITPFYGKLSLLGRSVAHAELFALAGATVGKFTSGYKPDPQGGLGVRFFLSEH